MEDLSHNSVILFNPKFRKHCSKQESSRCKDRITTYFDTTWGDQRSGGGKTSSSSTIAQICHAHHCHSHLHSLSNPSHARPARAATALLPTINPAFKFLSNLYPPTQQLQPALAHPLQLQFWSLLAQQFITPNHKLHPSNCDHEKERWWEIKFASVG